MGTFRILLGIFIIGIIGYTGIVIFNHGWNLLPIFFGDLAAMTWPGQFNFDFMCFLTLSGLWLAWRHHFSLGGLALGVLGFFGGIMVLAPYLLFASYKANGDIKILLLQNSHRKKLRFHNQMNLIAESNIRVSPFKDYYPKLEYSEVEFVQDTGCMFNLPSREAQLSTLTLFFE